MWVGWAVRGWAGRCVGVVVGAWAGWGRRVGGWGVWWVLFCPGWCTVGCACEWCLASFIRMCACALGTCACALSSCACVLAAYMRACRRGGVLASVEAAAEARPAPPLCGPLRVRVLAGARSPALVDPRSPMSPFDGSIRSGTPPLAGASHHASPSHAPHGGASGDGGPHSPRDAGLGQVGLGLGRAREGARSGGGGGRGCVFRVGCSNPVTMRIHVFIPSPVFHGD